MPRRRNSRGDGGPLGRGGLVERGPQAAVAGVDAQVRPVSGSMSVSSPTSTSASSRGSTTSMAMTVWRPATAVRAAASRVGPRKSETIVTSPAVVRDVATVCRARATVERPPPSSGGSGRERPEQPEHAVAAAGRRDDGLSTGAERDDAEPVRATRDEPADDERRALGDVGLAPIRGAEVHRRGGVEEQPGGELAVRDVLADLGHEAASRGVPVDAPGVVAGLVRPEPVEIEPQAGPGASMVADHPAADAASQGQLEASDEVVRDRAGSGPGRGARRARDPGEIGHAVGSTANSRRGAGTRAVTLAMIESGVTPSASAA